MKDAEIQQQFITLRADGLSYDKISATLNVSKTTLLEWGRKFQFEIHNLKQIALETMQERYGFSKERQLSAITAALTRADSEVERRDFSELTTLQVVSVQARLRAQL